MKIQILYIFELYLGFGIAYMHTSWSSVQFP